MDSTELTSLYDLHREGILRASARLLGDRATAEDVVQETWLKALERFGRDPAGEPLPAVGWFYRVALNLCYDRLRAAKRAGTRWGLDLEEPDRGSATGSVALAVPASPEEALLETELAEAVRRAVDALPPALREAVLLREGAGLKYREIAATVGCPVGTVMSRLYLARQRLKRSLGPYLDLPDDEGNRFDDQPNPREERDARAVGRESR